MELLEGLNLGQGFIIVILCAGLCLVGVVILTIIQFVTGTLGFILELVFLPLQLITGEPITGCGCVVVIFLCGICSVITLSFLSVIPQCGTADAVNLCRLLGY